MQDIKARRDKLLDDAADCEMIGSLAVDPVKRETFRQLAASYRQMANDLAVIIAAQDESKNAA
jgi:hypothetical protein